MSLDDVLGAMGDAGTRVSAIEASEGAAGNISVLYSWDPAADGRFSDYWEIASPVPVPQLVGAWIAVTGSGRRLREVGTSVCTNVALIEVKPDGRTLGVHACPVRLFSRPTSELNTHLALHARHAVVHGPIHTVLHAQPLHLTYLSHIEAYSQTAPMNEHILRWQPELIIQLHDGVGVAPYLVPGSESLMRATLELSHRHRVVVWSRHGAIARTEDSVKHACDLIEYAEAGARYEVLNLQCGGRASGIPIAELKRLCAEFGVSQTVFE